MAAPLRMSVLIVSWNGRAHLEACLPALLAERAPAGCEVEVLVFDNGSTDGSVTWLAERHPTVRRLESPVNLGFAAANNRLAAAASGDVLLLLNNDTRPEPGLLVAYADAWRGAPSDVAALAGRLVDWEGERLDFGRGIVTFDGHAFAVDQGRPLARARAPRPGDELPFGCGGNLLVRRRSFLDAGGFDESYFAYFEDVDLGWRLWSGGERVLACPEASARHRQGASATRLGDARRGALYERNALLTAAKNYEPGLWERMLPAVLLTYLSRIEALVATANPGGGVLRAERTGAPGMPSPSVAPSPGGAGRMRRGAARLMRRLAGRLDRDAGAGTDGAPRLVDAQTRAQILGLSSFLATLEPLAAERRRLAARRRRPDRDYFGRFPAWIVPTYPGDEALFASAAFLSWLPDDLRFERAPLDEVIQR